jgi:AcrR family transcriptional regulator
MNHPATLAEKRNDLSRSLILDASYALLKTGSVSELTVRAVAQQAGMSERTVFRYFPSRDALLDAVTAQLLAEMALPAPPESLEALLDAPRALYGAFEARAELTRALLHTDLVSRVRTLQGTLRRQAVAALLDAAAPASGERERRIATANICFHLSATSWHYCRSQFGLSLDDAIGCAETAVRQALGGVGLRT